MRPDYYATALAFVLQHEGGFVDHPDDPGGATNFGISLRYLRRLASAAPLLADVDGDGDVDADDIRALTPRDAGHIYRARFWDGLGCDDMPGQVAIAYFDAAVNTGPGQAGRLLQRALNQYGHSLAVDGIIGPASRCALLQSCAAPCGAERVAYMACFYRMEFYAHLAARRDESGLYPMRTFMAGWTRRVTALARTVRNASA